MFVPERDINHSVVDEGRKGVGDGDFLPTTLGAGGNKHTTHLASKSRLAPERACCVPESLTGPMRHNRIMQPVEDTPSIAQGSYHSGWEHRRGRHHNLRGRQEAGWGSLGEGVP